MYNVSRYPAKTTISATIHSVPEILFRKLMPGYSGTCEKNKARFHEKYCDSLFLFRCAFSFIFHFIFWKVIPKFVRSSWRTLNEKHTLAERGFNPRTSGLWAQHASTAPLCFTSHPQNAIYGSRRIMSVSEKYQNKNRIKNIVPVNILSLVLIKTVQVHLFCFLLRFNLLHRIASNKVHNQFTVLHQKTVLYL